MPATRWTRPRPCRRPFTIPSWSPKRSCSRADPKRELTVGGGGALIAAGNLLARATDKVMEVFSGERGQSADTPPSRAQPTICSSRARTAARTAIRSIYTADQPALKAQLHPVATAAIIGGGAAAAAGAFFGGRAIARKREGRQNAILDTAVTASDLAAAQALAEPHPPTEPRLEIPVK
jgi:hypothetical protein